MCLIRSFFHHCQVHLQRNTLSSQWVQCCFFPSLHYLQPKLLDALLFCIVLRQHWSFSNKVLISNLYKDLESWVELMHKNIFASLCISCLGSMLSIFSFQHIQRPEMPLTLLSCFWCRKKQLCSEGKTHCLAMAGELLTVTMTTFWNYATFLI